MLKIKNDSELLTAEQEIFGDTALGHIMGVFGAYLCGGTALSLFRGDSALNHLLSNQTADLDFYFRSQKDYI